MILNSIFRKLVPLKIKRVIYDNVQLYKLLINYCYDLRNYHKFNGNKLELNQKQLEAKIIAHYHVLEKGLCHPRPKKCFSKEIVKNLLYLLELHRLQFNSISPQIKVAISVLKKYSTFPTNNDCIESSIKKRIEDLVLNEQIEKIGFLSFSKEKYFEYKDSNFSNFAKSRWSIRDFSNDNVPPKLIIEAIEIAKKTPSVCNRQTIKVHILTRDKDIKDHLSIQMGNRGFGDRINKLLIISSDLRSFSGINERNQAFIDGGLFAMSMLYSLHHKGIGAITLNWAYNKLQDKKLYSLGIIPKNERVVLFIGLGMVPENFKTAASKRRPTNEYFRLH